MPRPSVRVAITRRGITTGRSEHRRWPAHSSSSPQEGSQRHHRGRPGRGLRGRHHPRGLTIWGGAGAGRRPVRPHHPERVHNPLRLVAAEKTHGRRVVITPGGVTTRADRGPPSGRTRSSSPPGGVTTGCCTSWLRRDSESSSPREGSQHRGHLVDALDDLVVIAPRGVATASRRSYTRDPAARRHHPGRGRNMFSGYGRRSKIWSSPPPREVTTHAAHPISACTNGRHRPRERSQPEGNGDGPARRSRSSSAREGSQRQHGAVWPCPVIASSSPRQGSQPVLRQAHPLVLEAVITPGRVATRTGTPLPSPLAAVVITSEGVATIRGAPRRRADPAGRHHPERGHNTRNRSQSLVRAAVVITPGRPGRGRNSTGTRTTARPSRVVITPGGSQLRRTALRSGYPAVRHPPGRGRNDVSRARALQRLAPSSPREGPQHRRAGAAVGRLDRRHHPGGVGTRLTAAMWAGVHMSPPREGSQPDVRADLVRGGDAGRLMPRGITLGGVATPARSGGWSPLPRSSSPREGSERVRGGQVVLLGRLSSSPCEGSQLPQVVNLLGDLGVVITPGGSQHARDIRRGATQRPPREGLQQQRSAAVPRPAACRHHPWQAHNIGLCRSCTACAYASSSPLRGDENEARGIDPGVLLCPCASC